LKHVWRIRETHTEVLVGNLNIRDHLEYLGVDRRIILERILKKCDGRAWSALI
jgi:hypothetical protein